MSQNNEELYFCVTYWAWNVQNQILGLVTTIEQCQKKTWYVFWFWNDTGGPNQRIWESKNLKT